MIMSSMISYSYLCDDYVLNDNVSGDLKVLRSALSAIATQSFTDVESRGRRLLRSYSHTAVTSPWVPQTTGTEHPGMGGGGFFLSSEPLAA